MTLHLIVRHGGRATRHEIIDGSITIGRDPSCNLFFSDKKLSRRHARLDCDTSGVKLVDLGSRNGTWVNDERVQETLIQPGDAIRLGGLELALERALAEAESPMPHQVDDSGTVMLAANEPGVPEAVLPQTSESNKTVMLSSAEAPDAVPPESTGSNTVFFSEPPEQPTSDPTVSLSEGDTGTVVFRGDDKLSPQSSDAGDATTRMDSSGASADLSATHIPAPEPPTIPASQTEFAPATKPRPWSLKFAVVLFGGGLLTYVLMAAVFTSSSTRAVREVSILRGRALIKALVASAERVGHEQIELLSLDSFVTEKDVVEALIVDPQGRVLAPAARAGEALVGIEGIPTTISDIRSLQLGVNEQGNYVMAHPLFERNEQTGVAVLTFGASQTNRASMVIVGLLILCAGLLAIYAISRSMTLTPLTRLSRSLGEGMSFDVSGGAGGYSELEELSTRLRRVVRSSPHDPS